MEGTSFVRGAYGRIIRNRIPFVNTKSYLSDNKKPAEAGLVGLGKEVYSVTVSISTIHSWCIRGVWINCAIVAVLAAVLTIRLVD